MSTHGENDRTCRRRGALLDHLDTLFAHRCRVCGCREHDACVWIADGPPGPWSVTCHRSDEDPTVCSACQETSSEEKARLWRGPVCPAVPGPCTDDSGWRFAMAGDGIYVLVETLIPGGVLDRDHIHAGGDDGTCSRCRRPIREDEVLVRYCEGDGTGPCIWLYCDDCIGFGEGAGGPRRGAGTAADRPGAPGERCDPAGSG